jgi:hypothetical protein
LILTNDPATGGPGKFAAEEIQREAAAKGMSVGEDGAATCRSTQGNRFAIRDILTAICEPSASISEQYMASIVKLKDGDTLSGRLIFQNEKEIGVAMNPFDLNQLTKAPAATPCASNT